LETLLLREQELSGFTHFAGARAAAWNFRSQQDPTWSDVTCAKVDLFSEGIPVDSLLWTTT